MTLEPVKPNADVCKYEITIVANLWDCNSRILDVLEQALSGAVAAEKNKGYKVVSTGWRVKRKSIMANFPE